MSEPAKKQLTFREYEQLPEGAPYQLIGGELTMTPSPTFLHQKCLASLGNLLFEFVKDRQLGEVVFAPMDVYFTDTEIYQPDIIFISNERKNIIQDRVKGVPDLVVEILSPSSAYYDLVQKKRTYEQSGTTEYWIVDPGEKTIEVFENMDGQFGIFSQARETGSVKSRLLKEFVVDLRSVF